LFGGIGTTTGHLSGKHALFRYGPSKEHYTQEMC
jgi:hypothetical protein